MRQKGKIRYILYFFLAVAVVFFLDLAFSDMSPGIVHQEKTNKNDIFEK